MENPRGKLGGGNHGHLALLITDTAYFKETQIAFIAPTNPGDDPPTALNLEEQPFVNNHYKRNQCVYEKYGNTNKVLKKQIEATVEAAFISTLHHELTGFNQVTALQLIAHIYATYGDIDKVDIEDNKVTMMKAYNPEKTLATLISQLEEGRDFAHIGLQPISENVMVTK
eukprot:scaffold11617_cov53-Attheya_sp.AAC.6